MVDFPSGNVTFLFTDIQGSTSLWERDPAGMQLVVAQHLALLGECVTEHGGVHFKTVGDAIQAAFHSPTDAVAAAVAGQRRLAATDWPGVGPLLVRMAVHRGPAVPAAGDYLAPCLNRLARLLSTGWGGQVLLTRQIRHAVAELPPGVTTRDLGRHRLRDLLEPEEVTQLVVDGLSADFPPLKSLEGFPTNLPRQPNPFVGRTDELTELATLVTDAAVSLVTIVGTAGTGKTRLALQLGAEVLDQFEDGVWLVGLGAATDAAEVLPRIAAQLGIREGSGQTLEDLLRAYLADRQLLLILDNLEHLPGAERAISELVAAGANACVVATSRRPLRLQAERVYRLHPLPVPDRRRYHQSLAELAGVASVDLFVHRATASNPGFALTTANVADIAAVCAKLDGLPLAIELAAARVDGLTPAELLAELDDRFALLNDGPADLLPHQQALWNTIAWSYDRLSPAEQAVFRRLALFRGGFTRAAAETVVTAAGSQGVRLTNALLNLVANSLLRRDGDQATPRYELLESLRAFGEERLADAGELEATGAAHTMVFANLAGAAGPHLSGPDQDQWYAQLDAERDNLLAALDRATETGDREQSLAMVNALWRFWDTRRYLSDGRRQTEKVIARFDAEPAPLNARTFMAAGTLADAHGDTAAARQWFDRGLRRARADNDRPSEASILHNSGNVALTLGDHRTATAMFEASQTIFHDLGDTKREAHALLSLGTVAHYLNDVALAQQRYEGALAIWSATGDRHRTAAALANLTLLLSPLPEHRAAARSFGQRCLAESRALAYPTGIQAALTGLGFVAQGEGDLVSAAASFAEAAQVSREAEDPTGLATALGNLAVVRLDQSDIGNALRLATESLAGFRAIGDESGTAAALDTHALILGTAGDAIAATTTHAAAAALFQRLEIPLPVTLRARHQAAVAGCRQQLGPAFEQHWQLGQSMAIDDVIARLPSPHPLTQD